MDKAAREILMAARIKAMVTRPYFSKALCAATLVEKPGIGTMACDAYWRIYYDPQIVKTWGVQNSTVGLLHELGHLLGRHSARAKALGVTAADHRVANIAQDEAINCCLLHPTDRGLQLLPTDALPKHYGHDDGLSWEEYYALHKKDQAAGKPQSGQGKPGNCGSGATGVPQSWEDAAPQEDAEGGGQGGMNAVEINAVISATAEAIRQEAAKGRGTVPAGWVTWAGTVDAKPQVRWQSVLQRQVRSAVRFVSGQSDYSYSRPSRRAAACPDVILPSMRRPVVQVGAIVDASGSMSEAETKAALVEVQAICKSLGNPIRVLSVDARVHSDQLVSNVRQVKVVGGGGTSMNAGIRHVVKSRRKVPCDVLVVLTDGGTDFPSRNDVPRELHLIYVLIGGGAERAKSQVPGWAQAVVVKAAA